MKKFASHDAVGEGGDARVLSRSRLPVAHIACTQMFNPRKEPLSYQSPINPLRQCPKSSYDM